MFMVVQQQQLWIMWIKLYTHWSLMHYKHDTSSHLYPSHLPKCYLYSCHEKPFRSYTTRSVRTWTKRDLTSWWWWNKSSANVKSRRYKPKPTTTTYASRRTDGRRSVGRGLRLRKHMCAGGTDGTAQFNQPGTRDNYVTSRPQGPHTTTSKIVISAANVNSPAVNTGIVTRRLTSPLQCLHDDISQRT